METAAWVQAAATVGLLGITGWFAWLSKSSGKAARDSAVAASRSAQIAEQSLLLASMPLVIPQQEGSRARNEDDTYSIGIGLRNDGKHTAFNVTTHTEVSSKKSDPYESGLTLAPGEHIRTSQHAVPVPLSEFQTVDAWRIVVEYQDPLGTDYRVSRLHFPLAGSSKLEISRHGLEGWERLVVGAAPSQPGETGSD